MTINQKAILAITHRITSAPADKAALAKAIDKLKKAVLKYYSAKPKADVVFKESSKGLSWVATWTMDFKDLDGMLSWASAMKDYNEEEDDINDGATPIDFDLKKKIATQSSQWSAEVILETYA